MFRISCFEFRNSIFILYAGYSLHYYEYIICNREYSVLSGPVAMQIGLTSCKETSCQHAGNDACMHDTLADFHGLTSGRRGVVASFVLLGSRE